MALYNPISAARPWQLGAALAIAAGIRAPETPVDVRPRRSAGRTRPSGSRRSREARDVPADMATIVILGASTTRLIPGTGGRPSSTPPRNGRGAGVIVRVQPAERARGVGHARHVGFRAAAAP